MLINTLDGIKRRSTVNLFNLFLRDGKLTEIDCEKEGDLQKAKTEISARGDDDDSRGITNPKAAVFKEIRSLGPLDFKQLVYQEMA